MSSDPEGWVRLLLDAARSHLRAGEHEAACECAQRASDLAVEGDVTGSIVPALSIAAEAHEAAGRRAQAMEVLADCVDRELVAGNEIGAAEFECRIGLLCRRGDEFGQARTHLLRSLQLSSGTEPGTARAAALEELGPVERRLGMSQEALDHLTEALRIREALSDRQGAASDHDRIGNIHLHLGQLDEAEHHYARALRLCQELQDRSGTAVVSNNLGTVQVQRGDYEAALISFQRARDLAEETGGARTLAWSTGNLGLAHAYLGNTKQAEPALLESIDSLAKLGDRVGQAIYANNLALVYLTSARFEESIAWGKKSAAQMDELGNVEGATKPWLNVARANLELGHVEEAEGAAAEVRRLAQSIESVEIKSEEWILEAALALARSEFGRARECATQGIEHASAGDLPRQKAEGLRLLGEAHFREGDLEQAREALSESESLFVQLGDVYDLALARIELGRLFLRVEAYDAAARRLRQAQEVFARLGHAPLLCRSWICLAEVEGARGGGEVESHLAQAKEAAESAAREDLSAEVEAARTRIVERCQWTDEDGAGGELVGRERGLILELIAALRELGPGETWLALVSTRLALDGAVLVQGDLDRGTSSWGDTDELLERCRARYAVEFGTETGGRSGSIERARSVDREFFFAPIPDSPGNEGDAGVDEPDEVDGRANPVETTRGLIGFARALSTEAALTPAEPDGDETTRGETQRTEPHRTRAVRAETHRADTVRNEAPRIETLLPVLAGVLGLVSPRTGVMQLSPPRSEPFEGIIGESSEMRAIFAAIEKVASSDAGVLVLGESGTGKELVARAIHERSARKGRPFVAISCPSIPRELIEAELFGHEKGAFTGAASERPGQIEAADGGTLFLDEIGDMDLATQTKLLRFLQEREFLRVGGRQPIRVDIRVLAATSLDLEAEIAAGRFRLDLYYRIGVVPLKIPPLRDRIQDVPPLVGHFLSTIAGGKSIPAVDRSVLDALASYSWPGNVRELRNAVEYVLAMHGNEGPVTTADLPARVREALDQADGALSLSLRRGETLEARLLSVEGAILRRTLDVCGWNQTRAARRLGLKESTMRYKMRRFALRKPSEKKNGRRGRGEGRGESLQQDSATKRRRAVRRPKGTRSNHSGMPGGTA